MIYTLKQFIDLVHESDTMVLGAPNHTITKRKYSVTKRKSIQKRITEVELDKNGIPYEVIKQKLITKEVHGFIPSSNKGLSDIEGIIYGKFLSLEIKVGKDTIRESQLKRKAEVEKDGGIYYLCKWVDFEQFQREIQQLIPIE
jgi:hypothetical protein